MTIALLTLGALATLIGTGFVLVAAIGLVRFPDLPTRLHATSKAGGLGVGLILLGLALASTSPGVIARGLGVMALILMTAPVAAHTLARAALRSGDAEHWVLDEEDDIR